MPQSNPDGLGGPDDPRLPPKRRFAVLKESGDWSPQVWCSVHDRHPDECWEIHAKAQP